MAGSDAVSIETRLLQLIEGKEDGISHHELLEHSGADEVELRGALEVLQTRGAVEARQVGSVRTWYPLQTETLKRVLIVEDDPNINRLMAASLPRGLEVAQSFDGREAIKKARQFLPDLILLDLMLPGVDGLDLCQTFKQDPQLKGATVIIVSAADPTKNRLQGIKFGADYYVRKPFEPKLLRSMVNIFLRKKGKKFDPLVDLPDEKRLSKEIERGLASPDFEIQNLRLQNLKEFTEKYGEREGQALVRLISQILQDKVREWNSARGFVGYVGNGEFVVGGGKNETSLVLSEVQTEFERVLPFIYQGKQQGAKLDIEDIFGEKKVQDPKRLNLRFDPVSLEQVAERREEILAQKPKKELGMYSLGELQRLVGSKNLEIAITRSPKGDVQISVSKGKES